MDAAPHAPSPASESRVRRVKSDHRTVVGAMLKMPPAFTGDQQVVIPAQARIEIQEGYTIDDVSRELRRQKNVRRRARQGRK